MRGTLPDSFGAIFAGGIIPAYAGNTRYQYQEEQRSRDHPRVCGEHDLEAAFADCVAGSSPRMRGTLICRFSICLEHGIIPAYAGNTASYRPSWQKARDHPRVCGEHLLGLLGSRLQ